MQPETILNSTRYSIVICCIASGLFLLLKNKPPQRHRAMVAGAGVCFCFALLSPMALYYATSDLSLNFMHWLIPYGIANLSSGLAGAFVFSVLAYLSWTSLREKKPADPAAQAPKAPDPPNSPPPKPTPPPTTKTVPAPSDANSETEEFTLSKEIPTGLQEAAEAEIKKYEQNIAAAFNNSKIESTIEVETDNLFTTLKVKIPKANAATLPINGAIKASVTAAAKEDPLPTKTEQTTQNSPEPKKQKSQMPQTVPSTSKTSLLEKLGHKKPKQDSKWRVE
jgi:hypothetical protein